MYIFIQFRCKNILADLIQHYKKDNNIISQWGLSQEYKVSSTFKKINEYNSLC